MSLAQTFRIGGLRCHTLEGGLQRLDGGAMFGVVPRTLWSTRVAPDERHRIPLAMRCLLVEHPDGLVLIDTALGNKEEREVPRHLRRSRTPGSRAPPSSRTRWPPPASSRRDVRWVINTHLHFDHAGGNTTLDPELENDPRRHVRPTFPNATYVVQRGELEFARHTNERTRASYLPPNFEPIAAAGRWRLLEGDGEVLPGISVRLTPGPRALAPGGAGPGPGRDGRLHRRPDPDGRPPAAALDHGVRPRAAPDAREQAGAAPGRGGRRVAGGVRARPGGRERGAGGGGEGVRAARRWRRGRRLACHPERAKEACVSSWLLRSLRMTAAEPR